MTRVAGESKGRWFQFSLRTLLLFVLVCALGLAWLGGEFRARRNCQRAVAELEKAGVTVIYAYQYDLARTPEPPGPAWLRSVLGDRFFGSVVDVYAEGPQVTDSLLVYLQPLNDLKGLLLTRSKISDAGLRQLQGLSNLEGLGLSYTSVSDDGMAHLTGLTRLTVLNLDGTRVGDSGLAHLSALPNLERLRLRGTRVTDAGLQHLGNLSSLRDLGLSETQVSDSGLAHLSGLPIEDLYLSATHISDVGLGRLGGMPLGLLDVSDTKISDAGLDHIEKLIERNLTGFQLDLTGTNVSKARLESLEMSGFAFITHEHLGTGPEHRLRPRGEGE